MIRSWLAVLAGVCALVSHNASRAKAVRTDSLTPWQKTYGDGRFDSPFSGPLTFAHLPYEDCLTTHSTFDIAIVGFPFDTSVTYRPGARFGPQGIRVGSRRLRRLNGWDPSWNINPYDGTVTVVDCGDAPITPFDNTLALEQMEIAYDTLLQHPTVNHEAFVVRDGSKERTHPFIVTLGGDHSVVLPILRSLSKHHGNKPITVLHFDSHIDTWSPSKYPGTSVNHGTFLWKASLEGIVANNSVHAGIRCKFMGPGDLENDKEVGFQLIHADEIDDIGVDGIVRRIKQRVGDSLLYLSLDIDVIDPAFAPATGTPEPGGWSMREMKRLLRGLAGLHLIGADIVEVAPAYDHADITSIAAADIVHEFLSLYIASAKHMMGRDRHMGDNPDPKGIHGHSEL